MYKLNVIKMTKEEEIKLYSNLDNIENKKRIFESNVPLAIYICNKYIDKIKLYESYFNLEDLQQVALIGLWKAIINFKPDTNTKLSTFAGKCIENEIGMELRKLNLRKHNALALSFEYVISESNDADKELCIEDILSSDNITYNDEKLLKDIIGALDSLPKKEKELFIDYHLKNIKQENLVEKYDISQSYVSKLLKRTANKIEVLLAI